MDKDKSLNEEGGDVKNRDAGEKTNEAAPATNQLYIAYLELGSAIASLEGQPEASAEREELIAIRRRLWKLSFGDEADVGDAFAL